MTIGTVAPIKTTTTEKMGTTDITGSKDRKEEDLLLLQDATPREEVPIRKATPNQASAHGLWTRTIPLGDSTELGEVKPRNQSDPTTNAVPRMKPPLKGTSITKDALAKIKIVFWNCAGGLMSKIDYLKDLINEIEPCLIFISEAELKSIDLINACNLDGFCIEVSTTKKGRVCCFIKTSVKYMRRTDLELTSHDCIIIDVLNSKEKLRVAGF